MEMCTFEQYLKEPYALDFQQMQRIHGDLLKEIGEDPEAVELYGELNTDRRFYNWIQWKYAEMR